MKTLLILGADAAASWLGYQVQSQNIESVEIYIDASNNLRRIVKLLWKGRLKPTTLIRLALANILRSSRPFESKGKISSNADLVDVICSTNPDQVLCFRCGLIINRDVLDTGVPVLNVHASSLPEFPGLGTIEKSIKAKAWSQDACLHLIDTGIDTGEVLMRKKYTLSPGCSYRKNEDTAYEAGVELAIEFLKRGELDEI